MSAQLETFAGREAEIAMSLWQNPDARHIVILAHGYGEHLGRYEHVAQFLVERGAVVAGPDHVGHGRSGGGAEPARAALRELVAPVTI